MPRYNVNQRRERPSRLDKLAELSALDAQQRASDEASLGGNLGLLSKLYGINQEQQLMPGRLEAQQLQNQGAGLANEGARFNLDWAQPRAMQQYETQDLGNKLTGTQLEQAPEVLRKLQLGNQQTEQFMPETLRGLRLGNDKSQNELDWYGPNAELQNRLGNAQVGLAEARAKNYAANAGLDPQEAAYMVQIGAMTPEEWASLRLPPEILLKRQENQTNTNNMEWAATVTDAQAGIPPELKPALLQKWGPENLAYLESLQKQKPQTRTYLDVFLDAIKDKAQRGHEVFNPWMWLQRPAE